MSEFEGKDHNLRLADIGKQHLCDDAWESLVCCEDCCSIMLYSGPNTQQTTKYYKMKSKFSHFDFGFVPIPRLS